MFILLLLGGLVSRDRVLVAAGTLVRAAHCIIEQIGRSGFEAENGGVREITPLYFSRPCDSPPNGIVLYAGG